MLGWRTSTDFSQAIALEKRDVGWRPAGPPAADFKLNRMRRILEKRHRKTAEISPGHRVRNVASTVTSVQRQGKRSKKIRVNSGAISIVEHGLELRPRTNLNRRSSQLRQSIDSRTSELRQRSVGSTGS